MYEPVDCRFAVVERCDGDGVRVVETDQVGDRLRPRPATFGLVWASHKGIGGGEGGESNLGKLLNEIQVQREGVRSQCETFHFSVYIFRY